MTCGDKGNSNLHTKAERGDIDGVKADVAQGANTSAKNKEGKTPAEVASDPTITAALNSPSPVKDDPITEAMTAQPSFVDLIRNQTRTGMPLPPLTHSKTTQSA